MSILSERALAVSRVAAIAVLLGIFFVVYATSGINHESFLIGGMFFLGLVYLLDLYHSVRSNRKAPSDAVLIFLVIGLVFYIVSMLSTRAGV